MMFARILIGSLVAASTLILSPASAGAQQLSDRDLIQTLGQARSTAPLVDLGLLAQELTANVGKGVVNLPNWDQLAQLPQLAVEINFENDSDAILPESYRTIGVIADALHNPTLRHFKFLVVGHASATGHAAHNLELSDRRAKAVLVALTTTFAVPPSQILAIGVGQELPLDTADPKAAINRRVQLINLGVAK